MLFRSLHELHAVDRLQRGGQRRLQRAAERQSRGVTEQMIERDGAPRIFQFGDPYLFVCCCVDARSRRVNRSGFSLLFSFDSPALLSLAVSDGFEIIQHAVPLGPGVRSA